MADTMGRQDLADVLERYIDAHTLTDVLDVLADIANEKADHILHNWQDEHLASLWTKAEKQIGKAIDKINV